MTGTRRSVLVVVAAAVLVATSGCSSTSSGGACAAPEITATPSTVKAGSAVQVEGIYFRAGCAEQWGDEGPSPLKDQAIVLTVSGVETELGRVDSADGTITTRVEIPEGVKPGPAQLKVGYSSPITLTIT